MGVPKHLRWLLGLSIAAAAMGGAVAAPDERADALRLGQLTLHRCPNADDYCGALRRPLDPEGRVPGEIDIRFHYLRRERADRPAAGWLVAIEGGPGYPSSGTRYTYRRMFGPLLRERDLLTVDARGTGDSAAIHCPPLQQAPEMTARDVARCGRQLGASAPLYSTVQAADDLAAVLAALEAPPVDLYGDSYGTWSAQVFAYRHPGWLRSLVLDSAYPVPMTGGETPWYPFFAPTVRQAFDKVCQRSAPCASLPGTALERLQPVIDALRAEPFDARAQDASGRWWRFRADASLLATVMFVGAPAYAVARELDAAGRAFLQGDRLPLLRLMAETLAYKDPRDARRDPRYYSVGLYAAVTCQDYAQVYDMRLPPAQRRRQRDAAVAEQQSLHPDLYAPFTIDEFRGMPLDYSLIDACVDWPAPDPAHPPGPPVPPQPDMPAIPVLVLSGELDAITTPPEGAIAASLFPAGRQVVVANSFHLVASPPQRDDCGRQLLHRFLLTGSPGDTGCAERVAPIRTPPAFARRLADVAPAQPLPGHAGRLQDLQLAAAVAHTLADAAARLESAGPHSVGLRGGTIAIDHQGQGYRLRLRGVRWTEDVAVDGVLDWPQAAGLATAQVQVQGPGAVRGHLRVSWPEQQPGALARVQGELDGRHVDAQLTAP